MKKLPDDFYVTHTDSRDVGRIHLTNRKDNKYWAVFYYTNGGIKTAYAVDASDVQCWIDEGIWEPEQQLTWLEDVPETPQEAFSVSIQYQGTTYTAKNASEAFLIVQALSGTHERAQLLDKYRA